MPAELWRTQEHRLGGWIWGCCWRRARATAPPASLGTSCGSPRSSQLRAQPSCPAVPWRPRAGGSRAQRGRPHIRLLCSSPGMRSPALGPFHRPGGCPLHILRWKCLRPALATTPTRWLPYPSAVLLQMGRTWTCRRERPARNVAGASRRGDSWREPCWAHRGAGRPGNTGGPPRSGRVLWLPDARKWCSGGGGGNGGGRRLAVGCPVLSA